MFGPSHTCHVHAPCSPPLGSSRLTRTVIQGFGKTLVLARILVEQKSGENDECSRAFFNPFINAFAFRLFTEVKRRITMRYGRAHAREIKKSCDSFDSFSNITLYIKNRLWYSIQRKPKKIQVISSAAIFTQY